MTRESLSTQDVHPGQVWLCLDHLESGDDCACGLTPYVPRATLDEARAEVERLRTLIGELYVARGGSRQELYTAIKRAFRAANPEDGECS